MTRQRYDNHGTEFGLWLRKQNEINSDLGFRASNIDFVWENAVTDKFILLEEKRYLAEPFYYQKKIFHILDESCKHDPNYKGFFILTFEKTSPEDGRIFLLKLDKSNWENRNLAVLRKEISKEKLINFLKLRW